MPADDAPETSTPPAFIVVTLTHDCTPNDCASLMAAIRELPWVTHTRLCEPCSPLPDPTAGIPDELATRVLRCFRGPVPEERV